MKTITVGQLRQNPTAVLAEVEAGEVYLVTRHRHEIARIVPPAAGVDLFPRKRRTGSRLAALPRHELRSASSIEELLSAIPDGVLAPAEALGYPTLDPVTEA